MTAINGFAELLQREFSPDDPRYNLVESILYSGQRAAELTRQLLAFSRKQIIKPKVLDLNRVVAKADKMLQRIIGENIKLEILLGPDLWPVEMDPAQVEQIILNLAVNARDAMPTGGQLTIETTNVMLDETRSTDHLQIQPGPYVRLAMSDTGVGMSEAVQARIFEPFFTTKEKGKGTGLGLASVFGIVKQNEGDIQVDSEQGRGTTFSIYLPRTEKVDTLPGRPDQAGEIPQGIETILVVEDDPQVRRLAARVLSGQGYTVLEAGSGEKALRLLQEYGREIQLLLTDVIMPQMSGKALADHVLAIQPGVKILFMSGYTDDTMEYHGMSDSGVAFLQKPFSPVALIRKVQTVLEEN